MQIDKFKRVSLVIIPIIIGIPFIINVIAYVYYYITIGILLSCIAIFWNFPIFIKILHTRPVYYEDILIIDNRGNNPNYLQNIFLYVNGTATIIFIIISGIYFYRRVEGRMDFTESVGIFGGITIVYSKIQMYFGKGILSILFYIKNKNNNETVIDVIEFKDGGSQVSDLNVDMPWLWCWCSSTQRCPMCTSRRSPAMVNTVIDSATNSAQTSVLSLPKVPYTPRNIASPPPRQLTSLKPISIS